MCQSFSDLFVLQALDYLAPFAAFDHVPKTNLVLSSANIPLRYALDRMCAPSQFLSISRTVCNTLVEFSTAEFKSVVGTSHWVVHEGVLSSTVM